LGSTQRSLRIVAHLKCADPAKTLEGFRCGNHLCTGKRISAAIGLDVDARSADPVKDGADSLHIDRGRPVASGQNEQPRLFRGIKAQGPGYDAGSGLRACHEGPRLDDARPNSSARADPGRFRRDRNHDSSWSVDADPFRAR
jgi:hypothetical protein